MSERKPVAIMGTGGRIAESWRQSTDEAFGVAGLNTGNLAFQYAVYHQIEDEKELIRFNFDPAEVHAKYRMICIPAANYLYSRFDFGDLAARLEAANLPLLVVGLGVQAQESLDEVQLPAGTMRMLSLFAERAGTIVVRGALTAEYLHSQGMDNVAVLGCPSNFINTNVTLGRQIGRRLMTMPEGANLRVVFAPTLYPDNTPLERGFLSSIGERLSELVVQEPREVISLARGSRERRVRNWLEEEAGILSGISPAEQRRLIRLIHAYLSVDSWMEGYQRADLVIGTRIHAVSLGWQAARPSVLVAHDLRTRELAESMGLPVILPDEVRNAELVPLAMARASVLADRYDIKRQDLAARYVEILRAHDLKPAAGLQQLGEPTLPAGTPVLTQSEQVATWHARAPELARPGFLETFNSREIAGWVRGSTPEAAQVVIRFDGVQVGLVTPEVRRPDAGADAWRFSFPTPDAFKTRDRVDIDVALAASGEHFGCSPAVGAFGQENPKLVQVGRNGMLFLDAPNRNLDQTRGLFPMPEEILRAWREFLLAFDELAGRLGAHGCVFITPSKECVLSDELPEGWTISENRPARKIEMLAARLSLEHVRIHYPLAAMMAAQSLPTFTRGDSHWTEYGTAVALEALWEAFLPQGGARFPVSGEAWRFQFTPGDLMRHRSGGSVDRRPYCARPRQYRIASQVARATLGFRREIFSTDPRAQGRCMLFHEWNGEGLITPLGEQFHTTISVFSTDVDAGIAESALPDLLIFQISERFLLTPPVVV